MTTEPPKARVPVIVVADTTWRGAAIFNPNDWEGNSKGIVRSCLAEFSALHHCVKKIEALCTDAALLCEPAVASLRDNWAMAKFPVEALDYYAEHPGLHVHIEAFLSSVKSLLDLSIQLLSSERIVGAAIQGFHHTTGSGPGGRVLETLRKNVRKERRELATRIDALLVAHKARWIDEAVGARDSLVHPKKGMMQFMFHLVCTESEGEFVCTQVHPPRVGSLPIDRYASQTFEHARTFVADLISLLREEAETSKK